MRQIASRLLFFPKKRYVPLLGFGAAFMGGFSGGASGAGASSDML